MSLPELEVMVGQMIVMDLRGTVLPEEMRKLLQAGLISGFLLFPGKDVSPEQIRKLTDAVRENSREYPAMIAIDQEGGRVLRLKAPFTQVPAMRRLGAKIDEKLAFEVGKIFGSELRAVGINTDFAPVVDLDLNPENQVIGDRSLGPGPETVAKLGAAIIDGLHSEKVVACAKHFPGHGASKEDSHLELPKLAADQKTIRERELVPFRRAIEAGVETVMVGHVLYPAFDKYHPATLSERIITQLLREEMRFDGVVIVDSLEMKALEGIPLADRAFMAVRAGADIMLICDGIESARRIHMAICQAVTMGVLPMETIYNAFQRIMKLKDRLLKQSDLPDLDSINKIVGSEPHRKITVSF
jgi:beta-N-acetylhexosaminidase